MWHQWLQPVRRIQTYGRDDEDVWNEWHGSSMFGTQATLILNVTNHPLLNLL